MRKLVYITENGETTSYVKGAPTKLVPIPDETAERAKKLSALLRNKETHDATVKACREGTLVLD